MPQSWARLSRSARAAKYARRGETRKKGRITVGALKADGVFELGRGANSSLLFVVTESGLHLFHARQVAEVLS